MPERRGGAGDTGIADENVELAVTFMQRGAEPRDAVEIGEVERHQCRGATLLADLVVEFLEPGLRARHRHDMRPSLGQRTRGGIADTARGAGDESDPGGEGEGHWSSSGGNKHGVIRGLDPRIHLLRKTLSKTMDCRVPATLKLRRASGVGPPKL